MVADQESTAFADKCVEHLARGNCHCQSSRPDVETNLHWPSCMVGKAQEYSGQHVTWRQGKSREEPLVCSPEATAPDYVALATQVGELVTRNQVQYGRSFDLSGNVLRILYPDGVRLDQYDDLLAVTRIVDKLFRIAAGNQGVENAYKDVAGYGVLGWARTDTP